jgi:hypothetical protein
MSESIYFLVSVIATSCGKIYTQAFLIPQIFYLHLSIINLSMIYIFKNYFFTFFAIIAQFVIIYFLILTLDCLKVSK